VKIDKIEIIDAPEVMVDITVDSDHRYWVSSSGNVWCLTHNTSWPDIDSDAGDRDQLIDSARELYGEDAVIPVSNFNTLKLKSLLQDVSKYFGVPHTEVMTVSKGLQEEVMPQVKDENTEKSVFVLKHEDCMEFSPRYRAFMEKYPDVQKRIELLFMQNRSIGRHAGGVIIAKPEDLESTMPLIEVDKELQTPWTEGMNWRNLEDNGFIKFDFLGLTLMKDVENCIRRILIEEGNVNPSFADVKKFFDDHLNCRFNEPNDQHVFRTAYHGNGWAPGLFQFTASGARKFCQEAKPTSIDDLAAITAIYRPGPLRANVHLKYVEDKQRALDGEIRHKHPIIEDVLGATYGHISFQEQFMILAQKMGGFTPAESDALRKTLVKKSLDTLGKKGGERDAAREKFVKGAKELHGIPESVSSELWERIEFFSVYGFNKSVTKDTKIEIYNNAGESQGILPIEEIQPGCFVRSRDETTQQVCLVEVLDVHDHGELEVFEITLDTGEQVTCTMEHKFRTTDGRMLPLRQILAENLSIVVTDAVSPS
jgi:DNA polymerase III subunit alpha